MIQQQSRLHRQIRFWNQGDADIGFRLCFLGRGNTLRFENLKNTCCCLYSAPPLTSLLQWVAQVCVLWDVFLVVGEECCNDHFY